MDATRRLLATLLVLSTWLTASECGKILIILHLPSRSHITYAAPLVQELGARGHQVVAFSHFQKDLEATNVNSVLISEASISSASDALNISLYDSQKQGPLTMIRSASKMAETTCQDVLNHPEMQYLIKSEGGSFDVVMLVPFFSDCFLGLVHKFKSNLVYVSPNVLVQSFTDPVGNPMAWSYAPEVTLDYGSPMNFRQRLTNAFTIFMGLVVGELFFNPTLRNISQHYFGHLDDIPRLNDIKYGASLYLINTNVAMDAPRPTTPNTVEVGGMHIRQPKQLPADLDRFMNEAEHGVIFFSLGSNLVGSRMPDDKRKAFVAAFSKLKQRILWKWDQDSMPGCPDNVKLSKWLPQSDILGHKKLRLFITHGGKMSTQETVYHGVPAVVVPVFADQVINAGNAERRGYGVKVEFENVTEESILWAVNEVLQNNKYDERTKELSRIFRDQLEPPLKRAVYWVEYVMRFQGADHIRSKAALRLSWYQYLLLDIFVALTVVVNISILMVYGLCKRSFTKTNITKMKNN